MAAEEHAPNSGEYIQHHLTHLSNIDGNVGTVNFHVVHWDSVLFSSALGLIFLLFGLFAARRVTSGAPGRFPAGAEWLTKMVDNRPKAIAHNARSRKMVGPMALTVFVWIFLLNA